MSKIDDKDLQDVSGGTEGLTELDGGSGSGSGSGPVRGETPTPGPGGSGNVPTPQGGSGGTTEMGPG